MAKIKFERTSAPIGSVEFSRNPSIPDQGLRRRRQYLQTKDFGGGGTLYVYDHGAVLNFIELDFRNNPAVDWTNLVTFLGVVGCALYNFTLTLPDGSTSTARIWNGEAILSAPIATARETISVELLIEA